MVNGLVLIQHLLFLNTQSVFCLTFIYNHNLNVRVCHRGRDLLQKIFYNNACFKWSLKPLFIFTFHVVFSFFFASVYCAGFNVTSYFLMQPKCEVALKRKNRNTSCSSRACLLSPALLLPCSTVIRKTRSFLPLPLIQFTFKICAGQLKPIQ